MGDIIHQRSVLIAAAAAVCAAMLESAQAQSLPAPPVSPAPVVTYEYDAQGNPTKTVQAPGALNLATRASYDALSRAKDSTDAKLGKTQFGYDRLDRTTQVIDPRNLVTQYPRNGLGDTKQLVSPDTGTASMTYDAAGNLKTRIDSRGVLATYSYDALNRLIGIVYTQSGQTALSFGWTYDQTGTGFSNGIGRLTSTTHPNGSTQHAYDPQGRLLTDIQRVNAATNANAVQVSTTVSYGYDAGGNVTRITYPSGRVLSIAYVGGAPTTISLAKDGASTATPLISQIQFSPFAGPLSWQWQMASGLQVNNRVYDTSGRLVRYRLGGFVRDLRYDAADRITSYTHYDASTGTATAAANALNQGFGYDELGRLTSVTTAAASWSIGYDANGNRISVVLNGIPSAYTTAATSNRLASITNPARSFSYDNAGNTTSDSAGYTGTYNLAGRLTTLTKAGVTSTYSYDGIGRRVRKFASTGAASTVILVYDQSGQLLGEYDNTGKAIREYVWLGDALIAVFTPDPASASNPPLIFYVRSDHLNTPRVIVDKNNDIRWRWMAEPFGVNAAENNPRNLGVFTFHLRMPGQYFDQESGLFYNGWRTYDPSTGRYTQSDPVGLLGGINPYAYVSGNPLSSVDPNGLQRRNVTPADIVEFITPGGYTQPITQANVNSLTARIRQYDANFRYSIIAPVGYRYNQQDVNFLRDLLRDYEESAVCTANGLPRPRINYGATPGGVEFTRHYGTETGPVRRLPGSLLDEVIARGASSTNSNGTTTHYDPVNNVTVVVGQGGGIVSAHRGPPD